MNATHLTIVCAVYISSSYKVPIPTARYVRQIHVGRIVPVYVITPIEILV